MGEVIRVHGLTEEELREVDPVILRAIIHERVHHTIEVNIYRILARKRGIPPNFGETGELLMDIWKRRGLPTDAPDIKWAIKYVELARILRKTGEIELDTVLPEPFSEGEMSTVEKLLYERRSIRQFKDEAVPN